MKRGLLVFVGLVLLFGIGLVFYLRTSLVTYALASRTVGFNYVIIDGETRMAIPGATIKVWEDSLGPTHRKKIAHLTTDNNGVAKFVREDVSVEDVIGISSSRNLEGVVGHPESVGTFVDRYWCILDITAKGYQPMKYESLASYSYKDKGWDQEEKLHRFEFTISLDRE